MTKSLTSPPLSAAERSELLQAEEVISAGLLTFSQVGAALLAIREKRLYRESHATFEQYCRQRWQVSGGQGRRLIAAAQIAVSLETVPIGTVLEDSEPPLPLPATESQLRPLSRVDAADRPMLWRDATQRAQGEGREAPTARHVEEAVQNHRQRLRIEEGTPAIPGLEPELPVSPPLAPRRPRPPLLDMSGVVELYEIRAPVCTFDGREICPVYRMVRHVNDEGFSRWQVLTDHGAGGVPTSPFRLDTYSSLDRAVEDVLRHLRPQTGRGPGLEGSPMGEMRNGENHDG